MDIIVHPFGRIHGYSTERVNYSSNRIAFGQLLLEECKTLRSRASINPYAEDKEDFCLFTMHLWLCKSNSV